MVPTACPDSDREHANRQCALQLAGVVADEGGFTGRDLGAIQSGAVDRRVRFARADDVRTHDHVEDVKDADDSEPTAFPGFRVNGVADNSEREPAPIELDERVGDARKRKDLVSRLTDVANELAALHFGLHAV